MRVIVFGSRDYANRDAVRCWLFDRLYECHDAPDYDLTVVQGCADGADLFGGEWAVEHPRRGVVNVHSDPHPADWNGPCDPASPLCQPGHRRPRRDGSTWCPTAGFRRNGDMANGGADRAAGFLSKPLTESRGTSHTYRRCKSARIPVELFDAAGNLMDWQGVLL